MSLTVSPFVLSLPPLHKRQATLLAEKPKHKFTAIACGTKFGKTLGLAILSVLTLINAKDAIQILWAAPYLANAKVGFKYIRSLVPEHLITVNKTDLSITFKHNNATIFFKGVNVDPEAIEGEAYHLVIIDEASKLVPQGIVSIRTTTTATEAPIVMASTPRGRNWFYEYFKKGQDPNEPDYISYRAPTWANPSISLDEVRIAKQELSKRHFDQYYGAQFVDDADLFFGFSDCVRGKVIPFKRKDFHFWLAKGYSKAEVVIGADWAKTSDYCVFTALDISKPPYKIVGYMRFQDVPHKESANYLAAFASKFDKVEFGFHDKTGLGGPMDELVADHELNIKGLLWRNENKKEMVSDLMIAVERKLIQFPNIMNLKEEFESYEAKATKTGMLTYGAPSGQHDDIVSSILMTWKAAKPYILDSQGVVRLDEIGVDIDAEEMRKEAEYLAETLIPVVA